MQILTLIFLPWIVYGILSYAGWFNAPINIILSFIIEGVYFGILYLIELLSYDEEDRECESALERARRIIG